MNKTKPYKLGTYRIGWRHIDVWISPLTRGGSNALMDERGSNSTMTIGFAYDDFEEVLGVVHHEALEFITMEQGMRFAAAPRYCTASDSFVYHFNHNQFTEMCAKHGYFLAAFYPDLLNAWSFHTKKKGKR